VVVIKVTFYSNNCPRCNILQQKLDEKGVIYEKVSDINIMRQKGFMSAPMFEVDGNIMNYLEAINWVKEQ
jgi:glutaredoxin-related protein